MGIDNLPRELIASNIDQIADTLTFLINKSLEKGEFPDHPHDHQWTPIIDRQYQSVHSAVPPLFPRQHYRAFKRLASLEMLPLLRSCFLNFMGAHHIRFF